MGLGLAISKEIAFIAAVDKPELFDGVFVVNPNFRELHSAEQPRALRPLVVPLVGAVQRVLRERGQPLFDALGAVIEVDFPPAHAVERLAQLVLALVRLLLLVLEPVKLVHDPRSTRSCTSGSARRACKRRTLRTRSFRWRRRAV